MQLIKNWQYGVLGIYNPSSKGSFNNLFNFLSENHLKINGDIAEFGVYKGHSLLSIAYFLKEIGSSKKVYGFDTFSGFPPVFSEEDQFEQFERLFEQGDISEDHYKDIIQNKVFLDKIHDKSFEDNKSNTSSSEAFQNTSLEALQRKIKFLGLDNIVLVPGAFEDTLNDSHGPENIMAAVVDCDLYKSYKTSFEYIWPKLSANGFIHLDEYYSLKFPGARTATLEFLTEINDAKLVVTHDLPEDFQRSYLLKENSIS
jgi:hypothetical protein